MCTSALVYLRQTCRTQLLKYKQVNTFRHLYSRPQIIELDKYQLLLIGPRDKIVLQTELRDLCDKLQHRSSEVLPT